ncbi:MAG: DUF1254 domain-containing protein [Acetobacteraceae bacterium]|nr:DUF1254 domain-containing protein [Acetobacteraceae bacterium]
MRGLVFAGLLLGSVISGAPGRAEPAPTDPQLSIAATPEVIARRQEIDAYALGLLAYEWGYPLVLVERVIRIYTAPDASCGPTSYYVPLNRIGWAREPATADSREIETPNNDTTYLGAVLKLDEPFVLSVPDTHDRYYVVDVFDMWHELEHYVGRRTTGTKAGLFVIVPPNWQGAMLPGATRLDVTTDKVFLWGRLRVPPGDDMAAIHNLQDEFRVVPLSAYGKPDSDAAATLPALPAIAGNPLGFFEQLGAVLRANAIKPATRRCSGNSRASG